MITFNFCTTKATVSTVKSAKWNQSPSPNCLQLRRWIRFFNFPSSFSVQAPEASDLFTAVVLYDPRSRLADPAVGYSRARRVVLDPPFDGPGRSCCHLFPPSMISGKPNCKSFSKKIPLDRTAWELVAAPSGPAFTSIFQFFAGRAASRITGLCRCLITDSFIASSDLLQ